MSRPPCPHCGRVYPDSATSIRKCRGCKNPLDPQFCNVCKQWLPLSNFDVHYGNSVRVRCKKCHSKVQMEYFKRNEWAYAKQKIDDTLRRAAHHQVAYDEWMALLKTLPAQPTLTEEQWQEACRFFKGCAICGYEHIEARQLFIRIKDGGKYSAVNVIPACNRCASCIKNSQNPFIWIKKLITDIKIVEKMCYYLVSKMQEVYNAHTDGKNNDDVRRDDS